MPVSVRMSIEVRGIVLNEADQGHQQGKQREASDTTGHRIPGLQVWHQPPNEPALKGDTHTHTHTFTAACFLIGYQPGWLKGKAGPGTGSGNCHCASQLSRSLEWLLACQDLHPAGSDQPHAHAAAREPCWAPLLRAEQLLCTDQIQGQP